jgi:hypothetical protein
MSPIAYQESVSRFTKVIAEYCALHLGEAEVAPVETIVVVAGVVAETVTCPAPIWIMLSWVPIGNAVVALVGIE